MINQTWKSFFLMLAGIGTYITTAYVVIVPQAGNRPVENFQFPQTIELNSVTAIESGDSTKTTSSANLSKPLTIKKQAFKASHQYQYLKNGQPVNLEVNYIVNTRGNVETYLQNHTSIAPEIIKNKTIKQIEEVGHHFLFVDRGHAHLTSCISPRSLSNINHQQFSQYRYKNDLKWKVIGRWLQGKASIRDRRCLWINLSTPLTTDTQTAYQSLETAWQEVYQWWLPNFPPLHN